jgi:hypothetical protein
VISSIVRQCPLLLDAHEIRQVTCRFLLLSTTLLIVLMPLSECFTTWDGFFPGGHDAEFGLLGIAAFFSLAAVLSLDQERSISLALGAQCLISLLSGRVRIAAAQAQLPGDAISPLEQTLGRRPKICNCPLRI